MDTYWLSFADLHAPRGQTFVGVVVLEAPSPDLALEYVKHNIPMRKTHFDIQVHCLGDATDMARSDPDYAALIGKTPRKVLLTREQLGELGHVPG